MYLAIWQQMIPCLNYSAWKVAIFLTACHIVYFIPVVTLPVAQLYMIICFINWTGRVHVCVHVYLKCCMYIQLYIACIYLQYKLWANAISIMTSVVLIHYVYMYSPWLIIITQLCHSQLDLLLILCVHVHLIRILLMLTHM